MLILLLLKGSIFVCNKACQRPIVWVPSRDYNLFSPLSTLSLLLAPSNFFDELDILCILVFKLLFDFIKRLWLRLLKLKLKALGFVVCPLFLWQELTHLSKLYLAAVAEQMQTRLFVLLVYYRDWV